MTRSFPTLPFSYSKLFSKKDQYDSLFECIVVKDSKIGLVVPQYVKAKSISDLKKYKSNYDGVITGIDAGEGVMDKANKAIKAYDLGFTLSASSGAGMANALHRAIRAKTPIAVTRWPDPPWSV